MKMSIPADKAILSLHPDMIPIPAQASRLFLTISPISHRVRG